MNRKVQGEWNRSACWVATEGRCSGKALPVLWPRASRATSVSLQGCVTSPHEHAELPLPQGWGYNISPSRACSAREDSCFPSWFSFWVTSMCVIPCVRHSSSTAQQEPTHEIPAPEQRQWAQTETGGSVWTSGNTFALWGWQSTGIGCPESCRICISNKN